METSRAHAPAPKLCARASAKTKPKPKPKPKPKFKPKSKQMIGRRTRAQAHGLEESPYAFFPFLVFLSSANSVKLQFSENRVKF